MQPPTPLRERPRNTQILLAVVIPFVFGAVVGIAIGISAALFWALSALAAIGGVLAGLEHEDRRGGALRGLLGGALYTSGLLLAHLATGADEKASLGSFPPLLIVFNAIVGMLLGILGAHLAARQRSG